MRDEELISIYQARGIPSDWQELTPPSMKPAFRLLFRSLPSPSIDYPGAEEAERLIHDPLGALREAGIVPRDETPHISTLVVNHQHTLRRLVMHVSVAVSANPHTVGITIVKEPAPEEDGPEAQGEGDEGGA